MRRLKKHQGNLNRILKDDRIPGSRKILAQTLAMWLDADEPERKVITLVLLGTFGPDPRHIWWKEDGEAPVTDQENTALGKETLEQLKTVYTAVLGEKM